MDQRQSDLVLDAMTAETNELRMKLNRLKRSHDRLAVANQEIAEDRSHLLAVLGVIAERDGKGELRVPTAEVEKMAESKMMIGFFTEGENLVIRLKEGSEDDESEAAERGEGEGPGEAQ